MVALLAFWMYMTPLEHIELVDTYDSLDQCISAAHSVGYTKELAKGETYLILDNGVEDSFGLNCQTNAVEV